MFSGGDDNKKLQLRPYDFTNKDFFNRVPRTEPKKKGSPTVGTERLSSSEFMKPVPPLRIVLAPQDFGCTAYWRPSKIRVGKALDPLSNKGLKK